jgi:hypothetical protein
VSFGFLFKPAGEEPAKPVRARTKSGSFKADDPTTPDVNEAWVVPPKKAPAKKATKSKE